MTLKTFLYRALSLSNDAKAVSKGPSPVGKRILRKGAYRSTTSFLRKMGL